MMCCYSNILNKGYWSYCFKDGGQLCHSESLIQEGGYGYQDETKMECTV